MNQFIVKPGHKTQFNATHHSQNVVIDGVDTHLSGGSASNRGGGKDKLENSVVDSGEVARAAGLVFLRAERKGIHVDTSIGGTGVVLEGLDDVEVRAFAFREAVLAVQLELGSHHGVLTPAVHVDGSLSKHEGASIRDIRARLTSSSVGGKHAGISPITLTKVDGASGVGGEIDGTGHLEETRAVDEGIGSRGLGGSTESVDGVGKSIDGISVVEGLSTEGLVEGGGSVQRGAVVHVGIGLDNPDQLLAGVVEVELDLVGRRTNRLISSELELLNQVFVGVLGELSALVSVQEDVVDVEGGGHEGLLVSSGDGLGALGGSQRLDGPEALTNGAEINVNLDFVILYESLIPPLSGYLSAFLYRLTCILQEHCRGLDYILSRH